MKPTLPSIKFLIKWYYQNPDINVFSLLLKSAFYRMYSKRIYADHTTRIKNFQNIQVNGKLHVGRHYEGFLNRFDRTFFVIDGELIINGIVSIGRGCRIYVNKNAKCIFNNCQVTGMSTFIISNYLSVGKDTIISWNCEFLDSDWHSISYEGKKEKKNEIIIGEHVWIGSNVTILKGVSIGNNCVIGAGSVVTGIFPDDVLIAGNPAKIIKKNIHWL